MTLVGVDGTSGQFVHARHSYLELPDGRICIDLRRFHEVEPDGAQ